MALDFGTFDMPVRLQVGDGEPLDLGTATVRIAMDADGKMRTDMRPVAGLLRASADSIEGIDSATPTDEGTSAASG